MKVDVIKMVTSSQSANLGIHNIDLSYCTDYIYLYVYIINKYFY